MRPSQESEEVLQALFSLEEEGEVPVATEALLSRARARKEALEEALRSGLVREGGGGFDLSERGREEAAVLARRHRLAERLLHDVLRVADDATESAACEFEHFLQVEVTESICTLLGHPRVCPHGKPIPPGPCCDSERRNVAPAVERLSRLSTGDSGTVAYVHTVSHGRLDRLASFGLLPGTKIHVHQTWPSFVISLDETQLALDEDTAEEIFVRRSAAPEAEEGSARSRRGERDGGQWGFGRQHRRRRRGGGT